MGNLMFTGLYLSFFFLVSFTQNKKVKHVHATEAECTQGLFIWEVNLLSKQLVVHLDSLHLFITLLQSLVTLTQLSDVVTSFGQDASFTLGNTAH